MIEIIAFAKAGGPLTKRIYLDCNDKLISDGSTCLMARGDARRIQFASLQDFANHIDGLRSEEAIALGRLNADLPDRVEVTVKSKLNGTTPAQIARTQEFIAYAKGEPALLLLDFDPKGMSSEVQQKLKQAGGFTQSLIEVLPALKDGIGMVYRLSTSAGLSRTDTGATLEGSGGRHLYILVSDGTDIKRALDAFHDRCWLAGYGWFLVGAAGQLLDRSIVDRMVFGPERLVFEGPPVLDPPLDQDRAKRRPRVREADPLDTAAAVPSLNPIEAALLDRLKAAAKAARADECRAARAQFIKDHVKRLEDLGTMPAAAQAAVERMVDGGVLLPSMDLPFDDPALAGKTVRDVLADPDTYLGETLSDPVEGVAYGICKAKLLRRPDGQLIVHSYAHGRAIYRLCYDADGLRDVLAKVSDTEVIKTFVRYAHRMAELSDLDRTRIKREIISRLKIGARDYNNAEKKALDEEKAEDRRRHEEERQREREAKGDMRPCIPVPTTNTPLLTVCAALDSVLAASTSAEPPMRDVEGHLCMALARRVPDMHTLTSAGANAQQQADAQLPAPEHTLITKLTEVEVAKLTEQHIDFVDRDQRSVRLPDVFVRAYHQDRIGSPLPTVTSIVTSPVILSDGTVLSGHYLDRDRGILFRVPDQLETIIPIRLDCTDAAIADALQFLTDEWLADVATDYKGKLELVALSGTILERSTLDQRPCFFITAGRRATGKTTTIAMIGMATLGQYLSAAAWSSSREERRKAVLAYMGEGVPVIVWDNILRGSTISCPSIEKSLTAPTYTDRVLSTNTTWTVPATSIHIFTGNNIGPKGDLVSRALSVRLTSDDTDPENRAFKNGNPVGWTRDHRGEILRAIYTIILGNPRLQIPDAVEQAETRFKLWWHLIGSAVEHAAKLRAGWNPTSNAPPPISFRELFLPSDYEDEQDHATGVVLDLLHSRWPGSTFKATEVLDIITVGRLHDQDFIREFTSALGEATGRPAPQQGYSARVLTWRLKALVDNVVAVNGRRLRLRYWPDPHGGHFSVEELP
jgi:hypothetical protein